LPTILYVYWYTTDLHRPTFADGGPLIYHAAADIYPVTTGTPPVSAPSDPPATITFQVAPAIGACGGAVAQTPHREGMIVALADGSCRTLAPNISPQTYWGAVTPNGGEVLGSDW
jgi:hypothetical protein